MSQWICATESAFLAIRYGMEYLMQHPHEPIMYSKKEKFQNKLGTTSMFFLEGSAEMNKNQECSDFIHTYFEVDHARDISNRRSVTSTVYFFNGTVIYWCANKKYETSRSSSNEEIMAISTYVLDQNLIIIL